MPADAKKSERPTSRPSLRGLRLPPSPNDVGAAPAYYGRRKKRGNEICQILLRNGAVAPESVRAALRLQEESGGQIGRILVAMGACTEAALSHALLEQVALRARGPSVSRDARANPALAGLKVHCRPGLTRLVLMTADLVAIAIALLFSLGVYWARASATGLEGLYLMVPQGFLCWVCIGALGLHGPMANSVPDEIRSMASASLLSLAGVGAVAVFGDQASRLWTLVSLAVFCLAASIALPLARALVRGRFAGQRWWGHPVVVLGAGKTGRLVVRRLLDQPALGLKPVMMLDDDPKKHGTLRASFTNEVVEVTSRSAAPHDVLSSTSLRAARELFARKDDDRPSDPPSGPRARGMFAEVEGVPVVGDLALAPVLAERLGIRYAIVAMPGVEAPRLVKMIERVGGVFSHLLIIPDLFGFGGVGVPSKDVGGVLGLEVRQQLLLPGPRLAKRFLDVFFTLLGGLVVAPVIALLALLVKLDSRGPVLYFQERLGQNGRRFWAAKLRTMHGDGEERLAAVLAESPALRAEYEEFHKLTNDPRVTRVGRLLRKYSLDELPQLWNVLRGDMSLVGPRPYLEREIGDMEQKEGIILRTVPGLTGMWQVSDRNATTFADRVRMDVFYVRNWSPWLDLYLLARTVAVVVRGTGV